MRLALIIWLAMLLAPGQLAPARAEVVGVEIDARSVILGGQYFADAGAYEKLSGVVRFAFDPQNPANARIVDLDKAPRNGRGLVEASANFMVLQPTDPRKRRGVALVEVSNRGGKASLSYFNRGRGAPDPVDPAHFGDGLLMRQGLTIIWVGWQWDVPERPGQLRLDVPIARNADGSAITGLVRADWVVERAVTTLALAHRDHIAYPVSDPMDPRNTLTVRSGRLGQRQIVPREAWRFGREQDGAVVQDATHIFMEAGFEPGRIYELVYVAQDPRVVGLGLAAIRDIISYAKHDPDCPFPARLGIAWGVSQTGRFLRQFLYQGFNIDEQARRAYDGMLIHTAGAGRGSFNHRFGQPSRDAHRFSAFFYPTDIFPFTSRAQADPVTGRTDGLVKMAPEFCPKTFYTNTGYEYWGRAAALIHTSVDGKRDIAPLENERIYHLASGQHFVGRPAPRPIEEGSPAALGNPLDFLVTLRALLMGLINWVERDIQPPSSAYPTLADGTLVPLGQFQFPAIPGVRPPTVAQQAYRADYGPLFDARGIVSVQPPRLGPAFAALVPAVDQLGNEAGGAPSMEILAPLATHTPWSLRTGLPGPQNELRDFIGMYIPLALTEAERAASGDERPSIEALYPSREAYLRRARSAAVDLLARGLLLQEDMEPALERMARAWDAAHGQR
ncbi:MAG: alpha/beta hydrolase domain-containing protein [Phycisphaerales bacterium JB039]